MRQSKSSENGSVLAVAIVAVSIATMIAVSYLLFASDRRERVGRSLNQAAKEMALEGVVLQAKAMIQNEVLQYGTLALPEARNLDLDDQNTISLRLSVEGHSEATVQIPALASVNTGSGNQSVPLQENASDPFAGARAQVTKVAIDAQISDTARVSARTTNKRVTASPEIDIRQIPVSEFTVYSAGSALDLDQSNFPDNLGRVFAEGSITVHGGILSLYPLVSAQNVNSGDTGTLTFAGQSKDKIYLGPSSGSSASQAGWINDARTKYDSKIITRAVLPVDTAPAFGIYEGPDGIATTDGGQLNLDALRRACTLEIRAVRDPRRRMRQYSIAARWVQTNELAAVFVSKSVSSVRSSQSVGNAEQRGSKGGGTPLKAAVPNFVVSSGAGGSVLLAINYATLPAKPPLNSIYCEVDDGTGRPVPTAWVVIRSAESLNDSLSIVTPHHIGVEGNFNVSSIRTVAASLITPQDIRAFGAGYFNAQLGPAK